jgi:metal-responsive CopG/Arc/MetJ family transcriptional regulator
MPKGEHHKPTRVESEGAVRASISFPRELYKTLEEIAKHKKVSLAWVVRDAAEKYVGEKWPLFGNEGGQS